jgi:hypothetical protein
VVGQSAGCPYHGQEKQETEFQKWLETGLRCSAGKREFKLDRYHVAYVANGADYARELEFFRREVVDFRKTGFLAIVTADMSSYRMAEDELWHLGTIMRDAGLTPSVATLINGEALAVPIHLSCPVTAEEVTYEFFPVAFCRNSANPDDPLYDPSLSGPFAAINTTSDAFAFAILVRELTMKALHRVPSEVRDREALQKVMTRATEIWQHMSINTILNYNRAAGCPHRAVQLSEDRRFWLAPHNDPAFAELQKQQHAHEMPRIYAARLCEKWMATMFEGKPLPPSRDGQAGGRLVLGEEPDHELHQL